MARNRQTGIQPPLDGLSAGDPLTEEQVARLLAPHEVVRDPVHGDIAITSLERHLIDTRAFQRLRRISQLGPTSLVYPGAVHNRFAHSLGVLHVAQQIVDTVNRNQAFYHMNELIAVSPYGTLLVRLVALLHDLAHIPFGHTLEDEGALAAPEWDDGERREFWLGKGSELTQTLTGYLVESGSSEGVATEFANEVFAYVAPPHDKYAFRHPYVLDIVGNTLCADLLDYVERDMMHCGLRERAGDRALKYLSVMRLQPANGTSGRYRPVSKPSPGCESRVVLLSYRHERHHKPDGAIKVVIKEDVLTDAIDLLRRRQALAEKVHFHRTKMAASSMLISAVAASGLAAADFREASDEELLRILMQSDNERTRRLITAFMERRLYRVVYRLVFRPPSENDTLARHQRDDLYPRFRSPKQRSKTEEFIEHFCDFSPGTVSVYCPEETMNVKEFGMLVQTQPGRDVRTLGEIFDERRKSEMEAINRRFAELWQLNIYVDPDEMDVLYVGDQKVQDLNALCESDFVMGQANDLESLTGKGRRAQDQLVFRAATWYETKHPGTRVPFTVAEQLKSGVVARAGPTPGTLDEMLESLKEQLTALMARAER